MFGISFTELLVIGAVVLLVVGPARLPKLLGTLGRWSGKLRRITTEVRAQSGIDDMLRKEGIAGGLGELRQLRDVARGNWASLATSTAPRAGAAKPAAASGPSALPPTDDPFADVTYDRSREYPDEGCDAYSALPADLWSPGPAKPSESTTTSAEVAPPPALLEGDATSKPSDPTS